MHDNIYIDLKKELDQSTLIHNFLKHRFQIALDQSVENSSEYPVGNEVNYNKRLIESKKEIQENCEREYNSKLEKEKEIIHRQYKSELDKLNNQVNQYVTIIENKNEKILFYISKNKQIEEEKKKCEVELKLLKESIKPDLSKFLDLYHFKT